MRRARPKSSASAAAPTDARRNREASPCSSNCHHSSLEYSDVLEREEPQPDRRGERGHDRRRSSSPKSVSRKTRPCDRMPDVHAPARPAAALEQRLPRMSPPFSIEAATPTASPIDRQVVSRVKSAGQALREQQQRRADEAADEVGRLDRPERHDPIQQLQPTLGSWCRAREEQKHAAAETSTPPVRCGVSASVRRPSSARSRAPPAIDAAASRRRPGPPKRCQWQEVVTRAIDHQRRQQLGRRQNTAEAAGPSDPRRRRRRPARGSPVRATAPRGRRQAPRRTARVRRQQDVEHGAGERPVDRPRRPAVRRRGAAKAAALESPQIERRPPDDRQGDVRQRRRRAAIRPARRSAAPGNS